MAVTLNTKGSQPHRAHSSADVSHLAYGVEGGTLKLVRPEPGATVIGTTTRTEYKVTNGVFMKRKVQLRVMGNQQEEGVHSQLGELYAQVMKAVEVLIFIAIAAEHSLNLFESDTKQAFLNGDIGDEKMIYVRPRDWWPEHVQHGYALELMKSMYGTLGSSASRYGVFGGEP